MELPFLFRNGGNPYPLVTVARRKHVQLNRVCSFLVSLNFPGKFTLTIIHCVYALTHIICLFNNNSLQQTIRIYIPYYFKTSFG